MDDERGLVRLRQRRPARPVPVQLRGVQRQEQRRVRRQQAWPAVLLHPARLQADTLAALPQQRRRHVHRSRQGHRHRAGAGQGAWRRGDGRQRRRALGSVRGQRHGPELPVHEPRKGSVGRDRAARRGRLQRQRPGAIGHGRGRGGLRPGRPAGSLRRQRRSGDVLALQEPRRGIVHRRRARQRRRTGDATALRLGAEVLRLRQRRPDRPAARQRPPGRHDRAGTRRK